MTVHNEKEIRARIGSTLQNQYSEHAIWTFYESIVRLVKDDLRMPDDVFYRDGRGYIDRSSLVDQLLSAAAASSGGILEFRGYYGGYGTMQGLHRQVLARNEGLLELLRAVADPAASTR